VNLQTASGVIVVWVIVGRIGLAFILPSLNLGPMRGLSRHWIAQGYSFIGFLRMVGDAPHAWPHSTNRS
jgi:hypothetical protein